MNPPEWTTSYGITKCDFGMVRIVIEWKDGAFHTTIHSNIRTTIIPQPTLSAAKQAGMRVAIGRLENLVSLLEIELEAEKQS